MIDNPLKFICDYINEKIILSANKAIENKALIGGEITPFEVEIPKNQQNGDFSTNFAMKNAKAFKTSPLNIANAIKDNFKTDKYIKSIDIAGPGFINFTVTDSYYDLILKTISDKKDHYGKTNYYNNQKILVEFVSANPTGPMHMGNARGGIIGDSLSELLSWAGANVEREFYVNDAGNQVALFAESLYLRLYQLINGEESIEFIDDGYHGDDIKELASEFLKNNSKDCLNKPKEELKKELVAFGLDKNIKKMQTDLKKYKINYNTWFRESSLHNSGYVKETIDILDKKGALYEKDGAKWFKATDYGCEKDEVMVKANGFFTYYAVDLAYHRDKLEKRKFDKCINVLGADHHGHMLRYKAGLDALGIDSSKLDILLMQLVNLMKDGQAVRMSKRTGKSITLSDLLDEITPDAARFFFNLRQPDTHLDFDLSLALRQDNENPLYYVQYAHARICSIIENLKKDNITIENDFDINELKTKEEIHLIKTLAQLPDEIISCCTLMDPSKITKYVYDVASAFHSFYNSCRIKGEKESIAKARLYLANATKIVIKNCLEILNVDAPLSM